MARKLVNGQWVDDGAQGVDWSGQLKNYMDQINNRQKFDYNVNADKLYQQYRDQYTALGKQAMADTMGQAAGLTGGYGNTYAQTAGQQAYENYLQQLNNKVPELYSQARAAYDAETSDLYNRYNLAAQGAERDYQQQRDYLADQRYQTEWDWKVAAEQYERDRQAKLDAADQAYRDWQMGRADKEDAKDIALMMIQTGKTPSADLLKAAGISAADAKTMAGYYANQLALKYSGGGGSGGRGGGSGKTGGSSGGGSAGASTNNAATTSNADAYQQAKYGALMALQTGNVDYAINSLDKYADYLTNDQLNEIFEMVERKFPGWKNPQKKQSATTKNNAAAQSLYHAMTAADKYGVNKDRYNALLAKKKP